MKEKEKNLLLKIKNNWKTPPEGRFISFKEIASLAVGGIGVKFIVYCVGQMILSVGNTLIGNTIGVPPGAIYVIYILSVLSGFPLTALRAKMIDNARSMKGKYRPYILTMGLPTVLLGIGFIWMPYENMSMVAKCVVILLFNIGFQFFYNFYCDAHGSIINVLSPNTIERTDVYAVKSVVENLSPSIANIFLPLVARIITGDNTLYNLTIYRVLFPPMLIVGFFVSLLIYINTEERIVQPRNHVVNMSFIDALRSVARNKYFWIISLAGWIGFLEGSFGTILGWMYNYRESCSAGQYALITAIAGNASLWPNLFGPFLIRRFGKKKVLVISNIANVFFIAMMLPAIRMTGVGVIWILLIFVFINQMLTSLGDFLGPSLNADVRDYQQYISGERIDGMFAAVGLIGNVITLATGSVLPMIYDKSGLNEQTAVALGYGADNVYDVLYNEQYFVSICSVLIIASVIGAALNVIPLFFYNLTETKQKAMVNVLRIRAYFEDLKNGIATEEQKETVSLIIDNASEFSNRQKKTIEKGMSGNEKKQIREENEEIEISQIVLAEINRFSTDLGKTELRFSQTILKKGIYGGCPISKEEINALPNSTPTEKEFKQKMSALVRDFKVSEKTIKKHYPDGVKEFDKEIFKNLFTQSDELTFEIAETRRIIKKKKEEKISFIDEKSKLKRLLIDQKENERQQKIARNEYTLYNRAVKPIIEAQKTIDRFEGYKYVSEFKG